MPKKKGKKQGIISDFTINDCANARKPVARVKKSVTSESLAEESWEELHDDNEGSIQKTVVNNQTDVRKAFTHKKRRNHSKCEVDINDRPGTVYPEIVWYLISPYIKPEEIGNFAGINQATYSITKRESFWRSLYRRYCQNKRSLLPEKFRIDNDYKLYGLRARVIRALFYTYDVFIERARREAAFMHSRHYELIGRKCVNIFYGDQYGTVNFKMKKITSERAEYNDFIKELGRIDANPEEDTQVLQVACLSYQIIPSLLGMILVSVAVETAQTCNHRMLHLGFNRVHKSACVKREPELDVRIGEIAAIFVCDWWHPLYPHFDIKLPTYMREEESVPVLKKNFFSL